MALVLSSLHCGKNMDEPKFIFGLEPEFEISPIENLSRSGARLALNIQSLHQGVCTSSEIIYNYRIENGVAIIALDDIVDTAPCFDTGNPPNVLIAITGTSETTRPIKITIKDLIENLGEITEYDDHYELTMSSTDAIQIGSSNLMKIQPSMIWGGVDLDDQGNNIVPDAFLSDIMEIADAAAIEDGYYGHFYKNQNNLEVLNDELVMARRSAFAFSSEKALTDLTDLVETYRADFPEMRFFLYNAYGEQL